MDRDAWRDRILLVLLLGSVLLQLVIQYRLNYWGRDFFDAFGLRVIAAKNAAEAQLRSIGSNLRERAFVTTASLEEADQHRVMSGALDRVIDSWRNLCFQLMRTTTVSQGNLLLAPVISWVLCAPKYLVGAMSLGEVAQVTAAFVLVQAALNWLVDNYAGLADCMSSINRVASLLLALDQLDGTEPDQTTGHGRPT